MFSDRDIRNTERPNCGLEYGRNDSLDHESFSIGENVRRDVVKADGLAV